MILFVFVAIVVLSGGVYFFTATPSQKSMMSKNPQVEVVKENVMVKEVSTEKQGDKMMKKTKYTQYSKATLDQSIKDKRILFFYANWCPTCKAADMSFEQNIAKIPADATLIRINYKDTDTDQEEKDLANKYAITYQHTFVQIDGEGKEISKWNGGQIEELLINIK